MKIIIFLSCFILSYAIDAYARLGGAISPIPWYKDILVWLFLFIAFLILGAAINSLITCFKQNKKDN